MLVPIEANNSLGLKNRTQSVAGFQGISEETPLESRNKFSAHYQPTFRSPNNNSAVEFKLSTPPEEAVSP